MRVMVLHRYTRNALFRRHLSGHHAGVVARVIVTANHLWLNFQQPLHADHRGLQRVHAPHVRHIADVRRWVGHIFFE